MDLPRGERTKSGKIADFVTVCGKLSQDFKGVFHLFVDIGGELNEGALLIINSEIVAVSLRDVDRGTELSGRDALNQLMKHILASVGDLDIYLYTDSEANLALSSNQYALLNPSLDLKKFSGGFPPEKEMNEEPGEGEGPVEEKPKEEIKEKLRRGGLRARKEELRRRKMKESEEKSGGKEAADSKMKPKQKVKKGKAVADSKMKPKQKVKKGKAVADSKMKPKQKVKKGKAVADSKMKPKQKVKKGKRKPEEKKVADSKKKPKQEVKEKLRREGPREAEEKPKQEVSAAEEIEIREKKDYVSLGALEEINAISARHLNTLLSTMIDKKVEMKGIGGGIFPINKIPRSMRFKNELIAGIYLRAGGDIKGSSMLLFPRNFALSLVDIKKGQETGTTRVLTSEDRFILRELGGVIIFSYMNTLSDFLDINLQFSAPSIAFDMANSIIRFMLSTIPDKISHILLLKTDFLCGGKEIRATLILLLDKKSTNFLLKKINRKKRG